MFWTGLRKNFAAVKTEQNISSVEVFRFVEGNREENVTKDPLCQSWPRTMKNFNFKILTPCQD